MMTFQSASMKYLGLVNYTLRTALVSMVLSNWSDSYLKIRRGISDNYKGFNYQIYLPTSILSLLVPCS